jgi:modulator of drug activity B
MAEAKKVLLINSHLTYPNWTEGTLNHAFYQAQRFFHISIP